MICIKCFHDKTDVTNSRPAKRIPETWRRRRCQRCNEVFTTREKVDYSETFQVYKGRPTPYDKAKLTISLIRVFDSTGLSGSDAYWICETIENKLVGYLRGNPGDSGVTPFVISQLTYETLRDYHPVAAMAYGVAHGVITPTNKRRRGRPDMTNG